MAHPEPEQQRYNTVGLHSLPVELARRILLHLHPVDLISLSSVSRDVRRLFRPADSEVLFAEDHLLLHFPALCDDIDLDSDDYVLYDSNETDSDCSDHGDIDDRICSDSDDSDFYSDSDDSDFYSDSNDSDIRDSKDDSQGSSSVALCGESHPKSKKEPLLIYVEGKNDLRRHIGARFQKLPLCYALALIKLEDFNKRIIKIMTYVKTLCHSEDNTDAEKHRQMVFFERVLLVVVRNLEMGFEEAEYEWEGRWYRRMEAYRAVRKCIGMAGSIEAARRVIQTEAESVTILPLGYVGEKKIKWLSRTLLGEGDPTDISESIREIAYEACVQGTVPLLQFLLDTYPESFSDLDTRLVNRATYLQTAFRFGHKDVISTLVDYMKRPPYGKATGAADPAQRYNPALSIRDRKSRLSFLQAAIHDQNEPMVRSLLELGADPNFLLPAPAPVRCADCCENCCYCEYCYRPGYPRAVNSSMCQHCGMCRLEEDAPLSIACCLDDPELISLLIAHGADPLSRSAGGETVLMECWSVKAASALLEAVEAHAPHAMHDLLVAQCDWGGNVLHVAVRDKNQGLFMVVMNAITKVGGSDDVWALKTTVLAAKTCGGRTPVLLACIDDAMCKLVLDAMFDEADPGTFSEMRKVLLVCDSMDHTPAHLAAVRGHEATLRKIVEVLSAVDDGLCQEVLGMKAGTDKCTPLHFAAGKAGGWGEGGNGSLACVKILLEHGADRGVRTRWGETPLMIAEEGKQSELVRLLRAVSPPENPAPDGTGRG
ncbi:hypothetical protein HDU96_003967 [Phlyctochytrium bullatum]|nr:hypothetical protein HDU96_003967 [Phlyctochytrium bullatum]